jgi:hypothetical protein
MGATGNDLEDCGSEVRRSILLDHDFSGLNHRGDGIALLELKLVGAPSGDGTFNEIVADTDHHVGHDIAQLNFLDFSTQFVSG